MHSGKKVVARRLATWVLVASALVAPAARAAGAKPHVAPRQPIGAPGATTTIDGKQLPPPSPKFGLGFATLAFNNRSGLGQSGTWFQPSYGANSVYYRVVPAP